MASEQGKWGTHTPTLGHMQNPSSGLSVRVGTNLDFTHPIEKGGRTHGWVPAGPHDETEDATKPRSLSSILLSEPSAGLQTTHLMS